MNTNETTVPGTVRPLLSILLPAYNYPEGVRRVIEHLGPWVSGQCEVLVFDDSTDDGVRQVVEDVQQRAPGLISYQRNLPPKGAASNWNALLNAAKGEYCWLIHHDEFPLGENFLKRLLEVLQEDDKADVLLMDCLLIAPGSNRARRHLPHWIRRLVVLDFPSYLFRRNVIGPTSSLVVRRCLFPRFDDHLHWLIDVEAYVRLRLATPCWRFCPRLQIGSELGRGDSITAKINSRLAQIHRDERAYLADRYPLAATWLRSEKHRLSHVVENCAWFCLRVITRGYGAMLGSWGISPVQPADLNGTRER